MLAKKPLCNGAATGRQCKHYWHLVVPLGESFNSVALEQGETNRMCMRMPGVQIFVPTDEMPHTCNQYVEGARKYDPKLEEYKPLSPEEIEALRQGPELVAITRNPKPKAAKKAPKKKAPKKAGKRKA